MQPYFITASGTGIGKTLVTTTLCWQLRHSGKKVTALKPVISGFDPQDMDSDAALILKSCGLTPTPQMMATISPWRYRAPLAANMAATKEGTPPPELAEVVKFCRDHAMIEGDVLLAEGAGGVMSPLSDTHTMLDLMAALRWPVLLVAGNYLGSISHTLTAVEALRAQSLRIDAVVVSESEKSQVTLDETARTLERFIGKDIPLVKLPMVRDTDALWKTQPLISWICNL
jgi:dethiobiotin synthetase